MQLGSRWRSNSGGLRGEEQRAQQLAASLDDGETACCVLDARGEMLAVNAALESFLGGEPGTIRGRSLATLLDGLPAPFREVVLNPLFAGQRDRLEVKARSVRADTGEMVWGRWDFSLVRTGKARPHLAVAVLADLTSIVSADRHVRILQYLIGAAGQAQSAPELLGSAVQIICHFTGCGLGQVWLPVEGVLACSDIYFIHGFGPDRLRRVSHELRYRHGEGLPGAAWARGEVVVLTALDDAETDFDRAEEAVRGGVQVAMAVPISIGGTITAVLELFVTADRGATDRATLIGKVASQLGELLERRRLNDALRLSEERFRSVADSALDAIVSADGSGMILTWNRGAEQMFGWRADEVVGRSLTVIVPERFRDAHRQGLGRVAATGTSKLAGTVVELAAVRRDGSELPIELSIGMWESGHGRGFSGVIRDITDRRVAEDAARLSEERFRSVADSAVDAIVSADGSGMILTWNRGAEQMFGWRADEVVGRSLTVIVPERFRDAHRQGLGRVAATGTSKLAGTVVELAAVRRDGSELPIELSIGMWESAHGRGFSGVIRDISDRKVAEDALGHAAREVQRTNAELETLIYAASHDLKSPMISVLGYLDYLQTDYGDVLGAEGGRYVERMGDCTLYMQRLIQDLIELSRVGRVRADTTDLDLEALVGTIFEELGPAHPAARFGVRGLPVVRGDPVTFRQLFTNLIENAVQHGGRADLTVAVDAAQHEDGSIELSVQDNGRGIPEEYRELVFGIFERLEGPSRSERSGTGMGLAICRKITEQMGGRIWISGRTGTDVRVVLPATIVRRTRHLLPVPAIQRLHRGRDQSGVPA